MAKTQFSQSGVRHKVSPKRFLGVLVSLLAAFLLFFSVIHLAEKYFAIRRDISDLSQEQQTLSEKKMALTKKNAYIDTPEGQEMALRERYNIVRPGEGMIIITTPNAPDVPEMAPKSRVSRWWDSVLHGLGIRK